MNIDEMEAGRELDALVAEVMGWRVIVDSETITTFDGRQVCKVFGKVGLPPDVLNDGAIRASLPHYSTDIAAAWQVDRPTWIWRFYEAQYGLEVTLDIPRHTVVANVLWTEVDGKVLAYALGRCRAALKAVSMKEVNRETIPSK